MRKDLAQPPTEPAPAIDQPQLGLPPLAVLPTIPLMLRGAREHVEAVRELRRRAEQKDRFAFLAFMLLVQKERVAARTELFEWFNPLVNAMVNKRLGVGRRHFSDLVQGIANHVFEKVFQHIHPGPSIEAFRTYLKRVVNTAIGQLNRDLGNRQITPTSHSDLAATVDRFSVDPLIQAILNELEELKNKKKRMPRRGEPH